MSTIHKLAIVAVLIFVTLPLGAQHAGTVLWTNSFQSGLADTFQMTLGGTFGNGPAWQNRITTGLANAFRSGDTILLYGSDTSDVRDHSHNWQGGIGYRVPVLKKRKHLLSLGAGLQHWRFPSVKTGTNDWLAAGNLLYQAQGSRLGFNATSDSWTLLHSPLPLGSVVHTQTWLQTTLLKREWGRVTFRTGPAHTYSWNFWGTNGNRIIRYQTMLIITLHNTTIEGGYRKQWGLQNGINDNKYWQFAVTRTFNLPLPVVARKLLSRRGPGPDSESGRLPTASSALDAPNGNDRR